MREVSQDVRKLAMFTDIHWGARGNEEQHNRDNLEFVQWFISQLPKDVSHIGFLGDWFESRSAINILTLDYAVRGMKLLNELDVPIIFITGNHDLHRRHTRDVHSLQAFNEFKNVTLIDEPTMYRSDKMNALAVPYMFDHEYPKLAVDSLEADFLLGHFEFKGFVVTGQGKVMDHGPDHTPFRHAKKVFSGHFHKRQALDNVMYIGNPFGTNFGDSGDTERGCAHYDSYADKVDLLNWDYGPKYLKVTLNDVLEDKWKPVPRMRVKCLLDADIAYSQAQELRDALMKEHNLRDFILEEDRDAKQALIEGETVTDAKLIEQFDSIDELVTSLLKAGAEDPLFKEQYDINTLVAMYDGLIIEEQEGEGK